MRLLSTTNKEKKMNVIIGLPVLFVLGIAAMGLCFLFLEACEKI